MSGLFWFVFGAFVGFDLAIAYAWRTTRRINRSQVVKRVKPYVGRKRWPW